MVGLFTKFMVKQVVLLTIYHINGILAQAFSQPISNLRLMGGKFAHEGNVQVELDGVRGFICDDSFGFPEADVICRELGYDGAETFTSNNQFGIHKIKWQPNQDRPWVALNCDDAQSIRNCEARRLFGHVCGPTEIAGVICRTDETKCSKGEYECRATGDCISRDAVCDGEADCDDGSDETLCNDVGVARLIKGNAPLDVPGMVAGPVQVKWRGSWWALCDWGVQPKEAKILCRSLGYSGGWAVPFFRSYMGQAQRRSMLEVNGCSGDENSIEECSLTASFSERCGEGRQASLLCSDGGTRVRVVDGGLLQVGLTGREWMPVCGTAFDDMDAKVVCRMMGYEGDAFASQKPKVFPGPIWNVILDCVGQESSLHECRLRLTNNTCSTAAAVRCFRTTGAIDRQLSTMLPQSCGLVVDASNQYIGRLAKVRGGTVPSRFDAPWIVSLRVNREFSRGGLLLCGGSIISEDFVLTAAHCFRSVGRLRIVVRSGDFNSEFVEGSFEEEFEIDKIWVHEKYEANHFLENDVALIKIERKNGRGFRFNKRVRPICLPNTDDTYDNLGTCSVVGWGKPYFLLGETIKPHEVEMMIVPDSTCENFFGSHNYTSSKVCAASDDPFQKRPCVGDSGGALVCTVSGRKVLYGLVSSGPLCGVAEGADIFVRLTKYIRWIQEKIAPFRNLQGFQP